MRKQLGLSLLALSVALAAPPALAVSLNLGGDGPLLDLSTPASEPTVSVDLGNDAGVDVDLGGAPDVTVDLGGESDPVTVDIPATGGSVIDLGGDSGDGIGVDLDQGSSNNEVELGLPGGDAVYVDLFGAESVAPSTRARVNLGSDDDVILDLFGNPSAASEPDVAVDVGLDTGAGSAPGTGLLDLGGVLGGDAIPGLFGPGGTVATVEIGLGLLPGAGGPGSGPGTPGVNPPGNGGDPQGPGTQPNPVTPGLPGSGGNVADNGGGSGLDTGGVTGQVPANRAAARLQAGANAKCFTPDDNQIAHLVSSRSYTQATVAAWRSADAVAIVPVQLCPEARLKLAAAISSDPGVQLMRNAVAAVPAIAGKLQSAGAGLDNVLAVESKGSALTVYVF